MCVGGVYVFDHLERVGCWCAEMDIGGEARPISKHLKASRKGTRGRTHSSLHVTPLSTHLSALLVCCPCAAGDIVNMKELGVWEPLMVKTQTFKTAIEAGGPGVTGGAVLQQSLLQSQNFTAPP